VNQVRELVIILDTVLEQWRYGIKYSECKDLVSQAQVLIHEAMKNRYYKNEVEDNEHF